MPSIINSVTDYIDTLGGFASVLVDTLTEDSESICVRAEPSQAKETRYMDGSRAGGFQFAIYAKSEDKEQCIDQLTDYVNKLDLNQFEITDKINITCEPVTDPHYISKLDNGAVIYTASFRIEYFQGA